MMLLSIYCTITSNKDLTEIPTSSIYKKKTINRFSHSHHCIIDLRLLITHIFYNIKVITVIFNSTVCQIMTFNVISIATVCKIMSFKVASMT